MVLADQPVGLAIMAKAPRAGAVKTRLANQPAAPATKPAPKKDGKS